MKIILGHFPDNAKPMSRRMRSRCQRECEADVKANAKPMSKVMRSRCQGEREADVKKALTRAHEHAEGKCKPTQTN